MREPRHVGLNPVILAHERRCGLVRHMEKSVNQMFKLDRCIDKIIP